MALTGHLSDLSLSELIEFFCNQRKSGSLKVLYPKGAGYFILQAGSVVDAQIGTLRGIDAVYYALTQPNAKFEFSASNEPVERTINQPWTQVVLEGLRRLDEGVVAPDAFPVGYTPSARDLKTAADEIAARPRHHHMPAFLAFMSNHSAPKRKTMTMGAVGVALVASVAVIGIPAGWYHQNKVAVPHNETAVDSSSQQPTQAVVEQQPAEPAVTEAARPVEETTAPAKRRERERKPREQKPAVASSVVAGQSTAVPSTEVARQGPKRAVVTVTWDESGRVTQASGADPTALRIARQRRFPAGRPGSTTITIPIN